MAATFQSVRLGNSVGVTTGTVSARISLPTLAGGAAPKFVRIAVVSGGYGYFRPGDSGVTASTSDILVGGTFDTALNVTGLTHIAYIQSAGGATNATITAVEA